MPPPSVSDPVSCPSQQARGHDQRTVSRGQPARSEQTRRWPLSQRLAWYGSREGGDAWGAGGVPMTCLREGTVRLADGRLLGFGEYGTRGGKPVLLFHGSPGGRQFDTGP